MTGTKKKWITLLLTVEICLWVGGSPTVSSAASSWEKIEEGLEVRAMQLHEQPYQTTFKLRIIRIHLEKFQVRILESRAWGVDRMEIKALAKKAQAIAAINGGFFLPDYHPLGLLIVDGRKTNPLRKSDWGIFLIQENRPRIIHTQEYQDDVKILQALQVGPRLVVNGRETRLKKQVARRSALGINMRNQILLLNTEDTDVYAQDLARVFRLPESGGGLECQDALSLDGGPSAQMFAEYKSLKIDLPGGWLVPNGIGVFKRQP
jgi:uncharacterized protein YigE (DUF2233 family)